MIVYVEKRNDFGEGQESSYVRKGARGRFLPCQNGLIAIR